MLKPVHFLIYRFNSKRKSIVNYFSISDNYFNSFTLQYSIQIKLRITRCKTSNDIRCSELGSEESTREEVGCGRNEDVKMDEWSHQAGQN